MSSIQNFFAQIWDILKIAFRSFRRGEPIVFSAAIAFFTIFSLPALLIILSLAGSAFFSSDEVRQSIVEQAKAMITPEVGDQIKIVLENISEISVGFWGIFAAIVIVLQSSCVMFFIIQKALNSVWQVRVKPEVKITRVMKYRLKALAIVAALGLLFIFTLIFDTLLAMYKDQLYNLFEEYLSPAIRVLNTVFYLGIVLVFFTTLHKVLPDVKTTWKDAFAGGVITSVLFLIGKQIINLILASIKVVGIYAAAGSLVVVLLWVFYSSIIFMLGAEVTKAYANHQHRKAHPNDIAEKYEKVTQNIN